MSIDFVAIDFETANSFRGSPCSLAAVVVRDGKVVAEYNRLMRPPDALGPDDFDEMNTSIHGITWEVVENEPEFIDVWNELQIPELGLPLVAHYAAFDLGVIRDALTASDCIWPDVRYTCSVVLARRVLSLPSYTLPYVTDALGITLLDHHNALADARACAEVLLRLCRDTEAGSLGDLLELHQVKWGQIKADEWSGSTRRQAGTPRSQLPPPRESADPNHFLFGKRIVITGALPGGILRKDAQQRIAHYGGTPQTGVTSETDFLVVGDLDPRRLAPGANVSAKLKKALSMRANGSPLEIISGMDFLAYLD
jgi:DNA polymerase-3 subunit epsilon